MADQVDSSTPCRMAVMASSSEPDGLYTSKPSRSRDGEPSFFKSIQWSADGTTIFTSSSSNRISSYLVPEDLLAPRQEPLGLQPLGTLVLPQPTASIAPCPYFSLENGASHVVLTASTDHPIHLRHCFPPGPETPSDADRDNDDTSQSPWHHRQPPVVASYSLTVPETEAFPRVTALLWPGQTGTCDRFLAGAKNLIAVFDLARSGAGVEPLLRIRTIPSTRHRSKGHGLGMRGGVAALASQPDSALVAAGTWSRHVALYDMRSGECAATWGVAGAADSLSLDGAAQVSERWAGRVGGSGIVQTLWSPDGRCLVVNERKAQGLLVYDLRYANRLLSCLVGRDADTNQRLSCDAYQGSANGVGVEIWAGTCDGKVAVWEGVGKNEGYVERSWSWKAHGSAVGSSAMHLSGSVMATCSGSWRIPEFPWNSEDHSHWNADSEGTRPRTVVDETSLKVWSIESGSPPTIQDQDEVAKDFPSKE